MLVARNENGDWFSLIHKTNRDQLLEERKSKSFFCPVCGEKLLLKLGEKNCFHFSHYKDSQCYLQSEPETPAHVQGKKDIYSWLRKEDENPILEFYHESIQQRADVGVSRFPQKLAFEFQCSTIPASTLIERDNGYRSNNVLPLWVWNRTRLKRLGNHLYHLSPLEWLTRRFPFSHPPHNRYHRQKGFLTFYDPEEKSLTFLYHMLPFNTRKLWAESLTLPLSELSLHTFLYPPIILNSNPTWSSAFLKQKKKWRTAFIHRSQHFEWHLQRLSESKGVIWKAFPGVVGNPLADDLVIETPIYLWQGWLCLTFLLHKKRGDLLVISDIKQAFMKLIERHWVNIRRKEHQDEAWSLVMAYINGLEAIHLLEQSDSRAYVIKETLQWGSPFFDELVLDDTRVLCQWNKLVIR